MLTDEQWRLPTDCRGWGVGDLVAHAAALESELAGVEPLRVTIDKAAPHIKSPAGVYTERGVVARRGRAPADVVAEFDDAVSRRTAILEAEALDDPEGTPTVTPGGIGWSWATLMRNRPLDIWVHEQDIRRAIGQPGASTPRGRGTHSRSSRLRCPMSSSGRRSPPGSRSLSMSPARSQGCIQSRSTSPAAACCLTRHQIGRQCVSRWTRSRSRSSALADVAPRPCPLTELSEAEVARATWRSDRSAWLSTDSRWGMAWLVSRHTVV